MGCSESKIDRRVELLHCRIHEDYLKKVIASRNALSDAHLAYTVSLRKLGVVFGDYGQSEVRHLLLGNVENTQNISRAFNQLDYHFFKGFESACDVSKFLEPTSVCHLSDSADIKRQPDYSVIPVITSNCLSKQLTYKNEESDDLSSKQSDTYAVILNTMLVWEKKLYEEVKASELMKVKYQQKSALLNKQQNVSTDEKTLEKSKASVSYSHARYIVSMNSLDFTVSEIKRLQEKQLYPKLLELVDGMAKMWQTMYKHHSSQLQVAVTLKMHNVSISTEDRSYQHLKRTQRLVNDLSEWHTGLHNLIKHQRQHVQALNKWTNLIPAETSFKEYASSKLQILVREWHELLEKVSDEQVLSAIHTLIEVIKSVQSLQEDEMRMKEKYDDTRREYKKKGCEFDAWYKYLKEKSRNEGGELDNVIEERKEEVDSLKRKLKEEEVLYEHACKHAREKSVQILKEHLPELFRALCEFASDCLEMYLRLRSIGADDPEGK